jgi:CBS domain-containing protein
MSLVDLGQCGTVVSRYFSILQYGSSMMNASDVMTPDVICAAPDTPLSELVRLMLDHGISALPIVADGRVVGIVSEGDLLHRAETGTESHTSRWLELLTSTDRLAAQYTRSHGRRAGEIMTRDVVTVADTMPIAEVAHLLEARRIKRVPVTRDGRLVGIVSRRNLMQALATTLAVPPVTADDRTIRDAFYSELRRQAWAVSPGSINAVVAEGAVHLWGVAADQALRQAIVVVAENIPGVRAVEDHMDRRRVNDPLDRPNWPSPARP